MRERERERHGLPGTKEACSCQLLWWNVVFNRQENRTPIQYLHQTPTYTPYDLVASYNFIESIVDVNVQVILSYILYLDYNTLYLTRSIIYSFYR